MVGNKDYLSGGCDMGWSKEGAHAPPPTPPPPPPPSPTPPKKIRFGFFVKIHLLENSKLKIRVVGFVLKKLLTYFEMLIVPHALQVAFLYFTAFDILLLAYWMQI